MVFDEDVFDYLAERQEQRSEDTDARLAALKVCLAELPEEQRNLVNRRYEPGASVQRIAEEDGKSVGSVSQSLYRIRAALQASVEKKLSQEGFA